VNPKKISPTITVADPTISRDFYIKNFGAKVQFDCGWYINISLGDHELCFMKPQSPEQPVFGNKGLTYNFEIENVDAEHDRLLQLGLPVIMPLGDHPWGDRGFGIMDSNGVILYFYKTIEPEKSFKQYFK
jgi:uncharacterized glyoxalase superfamily protein PhnB